MRKIAFVIVMITLVILLISGCGAPSAAAPEDIEPNYTNAFLGLSMWYPEDWIYEEQEGRVIFATSEEVAKWTKVETGAGMAVEGGDLHGALTNEEVLEGMVSQLRSSGEAETSDPESRIIGGQRGLIVTLEETRQDDEVPRKGFIALAEHEGWDYMFIGASVLDDWSEYSPVLNRMLDSVQFVERE